MDESGEKKTTPLALRIALALAALTLGWLLLSRGKDAPLAVSEATLPPEQTEAAALPIPASAEDTPVQNEDPVPPVQEQMDAPSAKAAEPIVYDSRSYQLVTDMVYAYKMQVADRDRIIAADVAALKKYDPRLGETWGAIMEYWDYANTRCEAVSCTAAICVIQ